MDGHKVRKKILFLTGTRADFGKLKPLMLATEADPAYECLVFVTGMHTLSRYGNTVDEVHKAGFKNIQVYMNQIHQEPMELVLANTVNGLSRYVHEIQPDLIVVHGDRVEALAGAIVGTLCNILVAHIEGGELSGTVDELIRHAVSKLSHIHFVANKEAVNRLIQLGEQPGHIFRIGSPERDIMLSGELPPLAKAKKRYEISFKEYAFLIFHPVTTELELLEKHIRILVDTVIKSKKNYIVIYPNNDEGTAIIFKAYERLLQLPNFKVLPSIRFEFFLSLLKDAQFIIGNSSVGVREAPIYGLPTINVGRRQENRVSNQSIFNVDFNEEKILEVIGNITGKKLKFKPDFHFGQGNSTEKFKKIINSGKLWKIPGQKIFYDLKKPVSG